MEFAKGDVRVTGELRLECKTTSAKTYSLKVEELDKIKTEAITGGAEDWAMQVEFQRQIGPKRYAVIDWDTYLYLREKP